jgi:putative glutathione S-transferase
MLRLSPATRLASPVDTVTYGGYDPGKPPLVRFTGRITDDGAFTARPSRYHVYGSPSCPWSHRVAIVRELAGLRHTVTMSYVDGERDGRGWAFRERYGPDPVNGFTLLRQAYEATEETGLGGGRRRLSRGIRSDSGRARVRSHRSCRRDDAGRC